MRLTEEQQAAVDHGGRRLVVSAGAGAGKTAMLVARYLRHVLDEGVPPEKVAALTFTKKSAAELRARVGSALEAAGRPDLARIAETGSVRTIDGWAQELLRARGLALGIDPAFRVLAGAELSPFLREAVRAAIADAGSIGEEALGLVGRLVRRAERQGDGAWDARSIYAEAEEAIMTALDELRKGPLSRQEVAKRHQDEATYRAFMEARLETGLPSAIRDELAGPADFRSRIAQSYGTLVRVKAPVWTVREGPMIEGLALGRLALRAWSELETIFERERGLDHAEVSRRLLDGLTNLPSLRNAVRARTEVLLVDEAQDLSPLQHRLLEAIGPEWLVMVGDGRQSIYGFREADVALFLEAKTRHASVDLTVNHRMEEPSLARFVDGLFGTIWGEGHVPVRLSDRAVEGSGGVDVLRHGPAVRQPVVDAVEDLILNGSEPGEIAVLAPDNRSLDLLAEALRERGVPTFRESGGAEFYAQLEVRDLANVLTSLVDPLDDDALLAFLHSPAVGMSLDGVLIAAESRPVLLGLDAAPLDEGDREALDKMWSWFRPLSAVADRLPAWEVIAAYLADSPYLSRIAAHSGRDRILPNIRKLLDLAQRVPTDRTEPFIRRLRTVQAMRAKEAPGEVEAGADGQVTLLTVHGAKGLEWDTVVLASPPKMPYSAGTVIVDRAEGLVTIEPDEGEQESMLRAWLKESRRDADWAEMERSFYVACTRARRRLVIVMPENVDRRHRIAKKLDAFQKDGHLEAIRRPGFPNGQ